MSNLSAVIAGGQTLSVLSGAGAIAANSLVQVGGPGLEAWPVVTTDHAALSTQQVIAPVSVAGGGATNNYARLGSATDILGNIYVLSPNTASQGVNVTKYAPGGIALIGSTALDTTAHAMIGLHLVTLSNSTFAAVYIDSTTGGVRFTIFDANLSIIAGPTAVVTGYASGAVAYLDACALSGGGFAIVYANSGHTAIDLQTYSNAGAAVLAATSIQATAGTASLTYLRVGQLSNGNLAVAMRQTATPAGTSFVIVTVAGASVVTNTIVDATSTLGFCDLAIMTGFFAISTMNGTNVIATVYSNAGAAQGSPYSVADTLNSTTYAQMQITTDGIAFYLFYVQSAGGLTVVQLTIGGASSVATSSILAGTFTSTSSIGASISNNMAVVLAASITTGGQKYITIGLPDSSLGAIAPYVITGATTVGSAAGTTGAYWPTVRAIGDFTAIAIYDQQSTANQFFSLIKFAASSVQGVAQNAVAANTPGTSVTINPGAGSYPTAAMSGTNFLAFDHSSSSPPGNRGVFYQGGISLSNPATSPTSTVNSPTTFVQSIAGGASYTYTASSTVVATVVGGYSGGGTAAAVTIAGAIFETQPGSYVNVPVALSAGQSLTVSCTANAAAFISIQKAI